MKAVSVCHWPLFRVKVIYCPGCVCLTASVIGVHFREGCWCCLLNTRDFEWHQLKGQLQKGGVRICTKSTFDVHLFLNQISSSFRSLCSNVLTQSDLGLVGLVPKEVKWMFLSDFWFPLPRQHVVIYRNCHLNYLDEGTGWWWFGAQQIPKDPWTWPVPIMIAILHVHQ